MLGSAERRQVRLIIREIIFEEFRCMSSQSTNVTDGWRDRWTTFRDNTLPRRWLGSVVIGRRIRDQEVTGSTPAAALFGQQPWASCLHLMCLVPLFTKQYNLVFCEGLHAKSPYCGSGLGSNEQGEYCRAVLKQFCRIVKNRDINRLLYFYFYLVCLCVCLL